MAAKAYAVEQFQSDPQSSLLPLAAPSGSSLRVRAADFARMCGVSRQSVSRWIKAGKVVLGADGRIDPASAIDGLMKCTAPARARVLALTSAEDDLVASPLAPVAHLENQVSALKAGASPPSFQSVDDLAAERLDRFIDAIALGFGDLVEARAAGRLEDALDRIAFVHFFGRPLADYPDFVSAANIDRRSSHAK